MADVATPTGMSEQVALVAGLRWQIFRNSLRTWSGRFDLLALILVGAMSGVLAVFLGLAIGAGAYAFVSGDRPGLLALLVWAVFLFWHFFPVMMASFAGTFDFRSLLRFPLRFSAFFLLSVAYGLFDPAAVTSILWLLCMTVGIALARPELLPATLLVLSMFAAMNLLLNRMVFSWLERLLARRRTREALFALFLVGILSVQFSGLLVERWGRHLAPIMVMVGPVLRFLPPGLAGKALAGAARGDVAEVLDSTALLAAYGLAFGLLLKRRIRAQYLGEDLGETQAPVATVAAAPTLSSFSSTSLTSSFLPSPVATVVEKEFRYLFRNSVLLLTLVLPIILIAFLIPVWTGARHGAVDTDFFSRSPDLVFPAAVSYMFVILAPLAHNSFAYDGRGIQLLFVAPVRFRDVLLGKNLTLGLILLVETGLVWLAVSVLLHPPGATIVMATFLALPFFLFAHFVVGNWLSLRFPRKFEFGSYRHRAAGVTALAGLALQIVLLGLAAGVYLLARGLDRPWLLPLIFAALSGAALPVYRTMLNRSARLAAEQREVLTAQLCR